MNVNYLYPEFYYPVYPEYYYSYYEPIPKPRIHKRSVNSSMNPSQNQGVRDDIDESVKQLIQMSKEQIAKEKVMSETKIGSSSLSTTVYKYSTEQNSNKDSNKSHESINGRNSPVIGETNRLAKHIVEILENIYQSSIFVNRKRREEIARELNLPVEKVRNWFQNRRGKDRRQNIVEKIHSRKYVRSGKYARKSDDYVYYDQKLPTIDNVGLNSNELVNMNMKNSYYNQCQTGSLDINFTLTDAKEIIATSPEKVKINKIAYAVNDDSPKLSNDSMPYWPSISNWENSTVPNTQEIISNADDDEDDDDDEEENDVGSNDDHNEALNTITSTTNQIFDNNINRTHNVNEQYEVIVDKSTNKTYIVLNDSVLDVII